VGTPKGKFFAWLIFQNRVRTSDGLARRNWDHSLTCPLCGTTLETVHHLVSSCRYLRRLWTLVAEWVGCRHLDPSDWTASDSVLQWWTNLTEAPDINRHGTHSLLLLVLWEIWLERNARIFNRAESSVLTIFTNIKSEASSWIVPGAKQLAALTTHV
jgi:hypothetical protein